jgi:hypothetical protein
MATAAITTPDPTPDKPPRFRRVVSISISGFIAVLVIGVVVVIANGLMSSWNYGGYHTCLGELQITDSESGASVPGAVVRLLDTRDMPSAELKTNAFGVVVVPVVYASERRETLLGATVYAVPRKLVVQVVKDGYDLLNELATFEMDTGPRMGHAQPKRLTMTLRPSRFQPAN